MDYYSYIPSWENLPVSTADRLAVTWSLLDWSSEPAASSSDRDGLLKVASDLLEAIIYYSPEIGSCLKSIVKYYYK